MSARSVHDLPAANGADVPEEDTWSVPAEWRRTLHPVRGLDVLPAPQVDATSYEALLAEHAAAVRARLEDPSTEDDLRREGLAALGEVRRFLRRAQPAAPTPLGLAAVAAALLGQLGWGGRAEEVAPVVADGWWAGHDVRLVVVAAAELVGLECYEHHGRGKGVRRAGAAAPYRLVPAREVLVRLRCLLAAADDVTWDRALHGLDPVRSSRDGAVVAAYLAPARTDWVAGALRAGPTDSGVWTLLLASVRTAADAGAVWSSGSWNLYRDLPLFTTLAAHLGPEAVPVVLSAARTVDGDLRRRYAAVLGVLPSDEAFTGLLSLLEHKGMSEVVLKAEQRQPFRATRLLAEAAAGTGGPARTSAALLRAHLSAHPETGAVEPLLRPAARAALHAATPVQDDRPVARPDQLPAVLVEAPWERPRRSVKPVVVPGLVASVEPAVVWQPGERERWRRRPQAWMTQTEDWDALLRAERWDRLALLAVAPREVGRRYLAPKGPTWCELRDVQGVLAQHEIDAVPLVVAVAVETPARAEALLPVASLEVALRMADWFSRTTRVRPVASAWLHRHAEVAALALVPPALGKAGTQRRSAERALRLVAGHDRRLVERVAASYGPQADAGIGALLAVDPLEVLPARVPALPAWLDVRSLPAVLLADRSARLDADAVRRLLVCLALSAPGEPYAGVEQALPALDRTSVAECAWAVVEDWRVADEPAKDAWVLRALGLVGDDETARRLSPLVVAWPKLGGSTKAATGLDVLAAIGTDVALMHLHRISTRGTSKPLRERAGRLVQAVAEELDLSTEQLADRLVPDFGLDPDGRAVLDYGSRSFVVGFDEALKPYVEEGGRRRPALPKPGAKDDPELAAAAYARFAGLKKDVRVVAGDQLRRFEQAMAAQRRWSVADQRRLFVEHPLLWHVARRLVWVVLDGDGRAGTAFRVAEDRSLADRDDAELVLPDDALVGIAHPLHLGEDVGTWAEMFADYEVLQPFSQLGREVLHLTDEERVAVSLTRFAARPVETKRVYGLAARGWERGAVEDAGVQNRLEKALPGDLVGVVDLDPGIVAGMPDELPEQRFTAVRLLRAGDDPWQPSGLRFGELDDVTASELLRDLSRVAGTA